MNKESYENYKQSRLEIKQYNLMDSIIYASSSEDAKVSLSDLFEAAYITGEAEEGSLLYKNARGYLIRAVNVLSPYLLKQATHSVQSDINGINSPGISYSLIIGALHDTDRLVNNDEYIEQLEDEIEWVDEYEQTSEEKAVTIKSKTERIEDMLKQNKDLIISLLINLRELSDFWHESGIKTNEIKARIGYVTYHKDPDYAGLDTEILGIDETEEAA